MGTVLHFKPPCRFPAAKLVGTADQALLRASAFQVKAGEMEFMGPRNGGQRLTIRCTRVMERAFHP